MTPKNGFDYLMNLAQETPLSKRRITQEEVNQPQMNADSRRLKKLEAVFKFLAF
jgi:hypothetical protein